MASSNRQREQDNGSDQNNDELETANESQEGSLIEILSQISEYAPDQESSGRGRSENCISSLNTRYYASCF